MMIGNNNVGFTLFKQKAEIIAGRVGGTVARYPHPVGHCVAFAVKDKNGEWLPFSHEEWLKPIRVQVSLVEGKPFALAV
jgi:hypothetical protein